MKTETKDGIHYIEIEQQCSSCSGTGLYIGMAERDGFATQCHQCKGTGKYIFKHSYKDFSGRQGSDKAKYVVKTNPGIVLGLNDGEYSPEDFGAIPYEDWKNGVEMPEMRKFTCPRWWNQSSGGSYDTDWEWCCSSFGAFSSCEQFQDKEKCWEKLDKEQ